MKTFLRSAIVFLGTFFWIAPGVGVADAQHLFFIERSTNKNIVQYDAHTMEDGNLAREVPMLVYWILENGEKENLSKIERKYAYGIESHKRLQDNRYEIVISALEERKITVKKTDDGYKAFVLINGREGILERLYVKCVEILPGLPQVLYVDLFGRDGQAKLALTERLFP